MMKKLIVTAATVASAAASVLVSAPAANADPVLWNSCSYGTDSDSGGLTCDGLRQRWIPAYIQHSAAQRPGGACRTPGLYALAADESEQLVVCRGGGWTMTVPWPH
jgi:hypothetical protein